MLHWKLTLHRIPFIKEFLFDRGLHLYSILGQCYSLFHFSLLRMIRFKISTVMTLYPLTLSHVLEHRAKIDKKRLSNKNKCFTLKNPEFQEKTIKPK